MPNFFKKLTGSLKMPEDEEFFEEKTEEEKESPSSSRQPVPQSEAEEFGNDELEKSRKDDVPVEESVNKELPYAPEKNDYLERGDETEGEEDYYKEQDEREPSSQYEGGKKEKPYTIAQLAKATTASKKKKASTKPRFERLKSFTKKDRAKEDTKKQNEGAETEPEGQLAIDVYETPTHIVVKSTIAGVDPKDLDIGIEENTINIRGSRHTEEEAKSMDYFYQECYWGTFSRSVILPVEIDADKAEASLKNGVLIIKMPKIQKEKEKKIKVLG